MAQIYTPGTYFCVGTPGLAEDLIKLGTHSLVDHCGIVVSETGDVVEAMLGGVRRANLSEYHGRRLYLSSPEGSGVQRAHVAAFAEEKVGTPYNLLAIANDGLESIGLFWAWLTNLVGHDHGVICSWLVAMCGQEAGFDWSCGKKNLSEVTPAMLNRRPGMARLDWSAA